MPFCRKCGKEISQDARFCPYCGADQQAPTPQPTAQVGLERKNTGLAAVLALIPGIFGLWGVGHIYVGKIGRGILLLILGVLLTWVARIFILPFGVIVGVISGAPHGGPPGFFGGLLATILIWLLICLAIFIWQIYDAYKLAKYYNEYVQQHGKAPW